MLLASYKSTRPGWQGVANRIIRWRLRGQYSHSEIVFEPADDVADLMPDRSVDAIDGSLWCVSSVAAERLPDWSQKRAGRVGGVRFKRIKLDHQRWDLVKLDGDARLAAVRAKLLEGERYDWPGVFGFVWWPIRAIAGWWSCAELCARLMGLNEPERQDPCLLHIVAGWAFCKGMR